MNLFLIGIIIFVFVYLLLNAFARASSKKIALILKKIAVYLSLILAALFTIGGKFLFSLPFLLMVLPLVKTKLGLSLFQFLRIWGLLRMLRNSGRFNFNNFNPNLNTQSISIEESYKILNLDPKKKYTKDEILNSYKKIMKKIHPDVSPELTRLASIVNEAKDTIIKDIS